MSTDLPSVSRNRREFLKLTSSGVSAVALSSLLNPGRAATVGAGAVSKLHYPQRAKSVILLYMSGGVSHVDSFDPKPLLKERHGQPMPVELERTQFDANGNIQAPHWESKPRGESGLVPTLAGRELFDMTQEIHEVMADLRAGVGS